MLKQAAQLLVILGAICSAAFGFMSFAALAWIGIKGAMRPPHGLAGVRRHLTAEFITVVHRDGEIALEMSPAPLETYVALMAITAAWTVAFSAVARWSLRAAQRSRESHP